jgi:hypothetical protein
MMVLRAMAKAAFIDRPARLAACLPEIACLCEHLARDYRALATAMACKVEGEDLEAEASAG